MATAEQRKADVQTVAPTAVDSGEPEPVFIKRFNIRLALYTLGALVLLAPAVYFVHAWQVKANAEQLKIRAAAAEESGDYSKALKLLGQYLNFRDDDYDALLHYLRLRDGLATTPAALSRVLLGYEELLRRDPGRADEAEIRQDIAALAMTLGDYSLALHHLELLLEDPLFEEFRQENASDIPELQFQQAEALRGDGRVPEAYASYLEVLKLKPDHHRYYVPLATLFRDQSQYLPRREKPENETSEVTPGTLSGEFEALLPYKNQQDYEEDQAADQVLKWMVERSQFPEKSYHARAMDHHRQQRLGAARQDVERARSQGKLSPELLLFSTRLAIDEAREARLRGFRAQYYPHIRHARSEAALGRSQFPSDPRFPLLQASIEEEGREGLLLFPAQAEKPDAVPATEALTDPLDQERWVRFQKSAEILQDGLRVVESAIEEEAGRKPLRMSLRLKAESPPLTRAGLKQIGMQLRWLLADTRISQHNLVAGDPNRPASKQEQIKSLRSQVGEQMAKLSEENASIGHIEFLEARLLAAEENWKEAAWKLEQTRLRLAQQPVLIQRIDTLLDECYGKMGNPDEQLRVAERALRDNPRFLPALLRLPVLYQSANRPEEALRAYEVIKSLPEAKLAIARLRIQKELNKPEENRRFGPIYELLDSISETSLSERAALPILRADVLGLEAAQLAELDRETDSQQKYQEAVSVLEEALASYPKSSELWAARGLLELKLPFPQNRTSADRIRDAAQIVEQATLELEDSLPLRLAAVRIASLLPTSSALSELSALEKPDFPPAEQPQFLEGLAQSIAFVGVRAEEQETKDRCLERIVDLRKRAAALQATNIAAQVALGELGFSQQDAAILETAIERVEAIEGPLGPNGNYLNAVKLILEAKPSRELATKQPETVEKIRRRLLEARKQRPNWAIISHTLGDLEAAIGNLDAAVRHYEKAYALGDRSREMITRMVGYYYDNQKIEYADEFLRKVALDTPILLSGDLARLQWRVAERLGRFEESVGVASYLAARSTDFKDHILEARLRLSHGERGDVVLAPLKKACELAKEEPGPWLALVEYHARMGNTKDAEAAIQDAKENIAKDPAYRRPLALARCYEFLNDRQTAESYYQDARQAAENDDTELMAVQILAADFYSRSPGTDPDQQKADIQKANQLLEDLQRSKRDVPQYTRDWARQRQALVVANSGGYDDTQRALELLAQGRGDKEIASADLRVKAQILARRNRHQDRLELIKILKTLEARNELTRREELLLARTYQSTRQWDQAQKRFRKLLREGDTDSKANQAQLVSEYVLALLDRTDADQEEQIQEAKELVSTLERLEPESFRAVTARAVLLFRQGKGPEAVPLLENYLERLTVVAPEQTLRDLVQQKKVEETLDLLEKHLGDKSGAEVVTQVRTLLADGKPEEALAILNRVVELSDGVEAARTTMVRIIARLLEDIQQYAAAESVYRQFVARSDRPEAVLDLALFFARRQRINESLSICDEAWEACDPKLVATVAVAALRGGEPTPAQVARVEQQLSKALNNAASEEKSALLVKMADLRDQQGRHDDSIKVYRQMLKENPQHLLAMNNLAWLLSYHGSRHAEALLLINHAIRLAGPHAALLDTRGTILLRNGEAPQAVANLQQAVEEMPLAATYFHLAQAQLRLGNKSAAQVAFQEAQAKELDPNSDLHVLEAEDYERLRKLLE